MLQAEDSHFVDFDIVQNVAVVSASIGFIYGIFASFKYTISKWTDVFVMVFVSVGATEPLISKCDYSLEALFYLQDRMEWGKRFRIWKFRSIMVLDEPSTYVGEPVALHLVKNIQTGPALLVVHRSKGLSLHLKFRTLKRPPRPMVCPQFAYKTRCSDLLAYADRCFVWAWAR